ncbi:DMT family transporter [Amycolatopsis palatopharyngis]|uniref:DMT family transporter n=1 Tax=Amycolatopsis palatopharyngis TaxID=187982 RepID=UPI000E21F776|nr:multidrug efflux SMR transporter [Amycolatopsis palatopharyngis]
MSWVFLISAILTEVFATTCMKLSEGFTRLWPSVGMAVGYLAAFAFLTFALKSFEVGTAYALWAGLGTALVAIIGVLLLGEAFTWTKVAGIVLVIGGVVVLNLGGAH